MKVFEHVKIDLGYEDLVAETSKSGRKYVDPDGNSYPSITTVLSILSEEAIQAWRERVGAEEARLVIKHLHVALQYTQSLRII